MEKRLVYYDAWKKENTKINWKYMCYEQIEVTEGKNIYIPLKYQRILVQNKCNTVWNFQCNRQNSITPPSIGHFAKHTYRRNELCWLILKFKTKKQISKTREKVVYPSHIIILRAEGYWIGQDNSNIISTFTCISEKRYHVYSHISHSSR